MGKATVEYPFTDICGKVNKTDMAYFCHRNGKTFIRRVKNPYKGDPTTDQIVSREKFRTAHRYAAAILRAGPGDDTYDNYLNAWKSNPGRYGTLYGYIFAAEYNSL